MMTGVGDGTTERFSGMRSRLVSIGVTAALAAALSVAATAGGASAASDFTPPVLSASAKGAPVLGQSITTRLELVGTDPDEYEYLSVVALRLSWSASDASGVCGYSLWEMHASTEPRALFENRMVTSYTVYADEFVNDVFGGGGDFVSGWKVTAIDCVGNATDPDDFTRGFFPNSVQVHQNDNTVATATPTRPPPGLLTYSGSWSISNCVCWSGPTTHKTSTRTASATYTRRFAAGDYVALVMATGPDRGRAAVYVDGVQRATIDTYASVKGFRVVEWRAKMTAGTHAIKIVNLATAGRPRIDLDAVVVS